MPGLWPDPKRRTCPVFHLPALTGSWALCRGPDAPVYRRATRPFVFDHNLAKGREDVVLVHLNHRLVQMSLRLLRAEVWSREGRKRLHRITARIVPDNALQHPAVVAHARLVVIGGDRHRLHEEIITAGGCCGKGGSSASQPAGNAGSPWPQRLTSEPSEQVTEEAAGPLAENVGVAAAGPRSPHEGPHRRASKSPGRAGEEGSQATSGRSSPSCGRRFRMNLTRLPRKSSCSCSPRPRKSNLTGTRMPCGQGSRRFPSEIEKETEAIRERFADPQPRMFPVAVTYLVPEKMAKG